MTRITQKGIIIEEYSTIYVLYITKIEVVNDCTTVIKPLGKPRLFNKNPSICRVYPPATAQPAPGSLPEKQGKGAYEPKRHPMSHEKHKKSTSGRCESGYILPFHHMFKISFTSSKTCNKCLFRYIIAKSRIHPRSKSSKLGNRHHRKQQDPPPPEYPSRSCPQDQQRSAVLSIHQDAPAHYRQSERA